MAAFGSKSPTSLYTTTWAFDVYRPSPPTRSAITTKASGTLGSGTCAQPGGTGSTMLSALKSRPFCGCSLTPLSLKKSASVTEVAGTSVSGGGGGIGGGAGGEGRARAAERRGARSPAGLPWCDGTGGRHHRDRLRHGRRGGHR